MSYWKPTNEDRAMWAQAAIAEFQRVVPTDDCDAIADLLCDIMHLCRIAENDFEAQLSRARRNFEDEEDGD